MAPAAEVSGVETLVRLCAPASGVAAPAAMMVLAHPDDETVGGASLLAALTRATFAYLTDGSPRDLRDARAAGCASRAAYAQRRDEELRAALGGAGITDDRIARGGCVDQEASMQLVALTRWLEGLVRAHAPAVVLTHPYEGGHPDHDAAAFATHCACRLIAAAGDRPPVVAEFTSYHRTRRFGANPRSGPDEPGPEGAWEFGRFLAPDDPRHVLTRVLSPAEAALKQRLIRCYPSQHGVLRNVPLDVERFRVAPDYDFTAPPHEGPLLYEQFPWGMTGAEWRERAGSALAALGLLPATSRNRMRSTMSSGAAARR